MMLHRRLTAAAEAREANPEPLRASDKPKTGKSATKRPAASPGASQGRTAAKRK